MDTFLLCDEAWLSTPPPTPGYCNNVESYSSSSLYTSKEECEQAFSIYFEKELTYMPQQGYLEHLHFKNLFSARFRAIQWLIKSRSRLDLSFITLFNAVNYFDRFVSINQCKGWRHWMVELLSVACLSVATKFTETFTPTLYEIQNEIIKCHKIMEEKMANGNLLNYCPSSPVTVLLTEEKIDVYDTQIDLSLFQVSNTDTESSNKRRKREVS
ncbi:hypothetical protein JCGZ_09106 [Jatropha curcas]|uniref:B-like cyclin n=1 Tax=Jatropha curcas TaxID=180498 RepID=A0A067KL04_JATCU|nr:hypothetical protein JCGZ_09106 [Jatropha curcas]